MEKLKPLINLVDNMVKLGSTSSPDKHLQRRQQNQQQQQQQVQNRSPDVKYMTLPHLPGRAMPVTKWLPQQVPAQPVYTQFDSPTYTNVQQLRNSANGNLSYPQPPHQPVFRRAAEPVYNNTVYDNTVYDNSVYGEPVYGEPIYGGSCVQGWEEAQIAQLDSKHHQLAQLEKFVREEGMAIQRLTQNQNVLKLAIRGIREQTNSALQKSDYIEVNHCRRQQMFLEQELSQIHSLLALSSKRLEDAAVEINRIEREISTLHQHLHRNNRYGRNSQQNASRFNGREMAWLEAELNRVQQHVSQLQMRRQELSSQVARLTSAELNSSIEAIESWNSTSYNSTDSMTLRPHNTW